VGAAADARSLENLHLIYQTLRYQFILQGI
jgi:hypothetical protein